MTQTIFQLLALIYSINLVLCAPLNYTGEDKDETGYGFERQLDENNPNMEKEINLPEIMSLCNESFRISYDFIQEFNNSGSLPDETDKTPMCFMRCVLEKAQILNGGVINKSRVTEMLWPATGDSVEACQAEGDEEQHPCKKAYAIAKCMMTRALVDAKNKMAD